MYDCFSSFHRHNITKQFFGLKQPLFTTTEYLVRVSNLPDNLKSKTEILKTATSREKELVSKNSISR